MSLFISSIASGSNGNCYYIGNDREAVIVDAGISCREIEKRMKRLDLSLQKVRALFISHEHSDHIKGVSVLAKKYGLPVYITTPTLMFGGLNLDKSMVRPFKSYEPVVIGDLSITAFPKFHDASDPYSFTVSSKEVKVGVFTDIGQPCRHVISQFQQCNAAFLESNYDEEMLENGSYPYYLKRRIRGGQGHLSNRQALDLFLQYRSSDLSHLLLSHLSRNNNCPMVVENLFTPHAGATKIVVASRYEESPLFEVRAKNAPFSLDHRQVQPAQLEFSF